MNKFIAQELKKVAFAKLPPFDDNATEIFIPKTTERIRLEVNQCYIIELSDDIFLNSNLAQTWNNGVSPTSKYMKVCILEKSNGMLKVDGSGYDYKNDTDFNDVYIGLWLPNDSVRAVKNI